MIQQIGKNLRSHFLMALVYCVCFTGHILAQEQEESEYEQKIAQCTDSVVAYVNIEPSISKRYAFQGLSTASKARNQEDKAFFYNVLGVIYKSQSSYDSSRYYFKRAIKTHEHTGDVFQEGATNNNLARLYVLMSNYDLALEHFQRALVLFNETKAYYEIATVHSSLGEMYIELDDDELAIEHLKKSEAIYTQEGFEDGIVMVHFDLGLIAKKKGKLQEALVDFQKASEYWRKEKVYKNLLLVLLEEAEILISLEEYTPANRKLIESSQISEHLADRFMKCKGIVLQARIARKRGQHGQAYQLLKQADQLNIYRESPKLEAMVLFEKYLSHKKTGDIHGALTYYERYQKVNDSISGIEQQKTLTGTRLRFDLLNKEKRIQGLLDSTRIQRLKNQKIALKNEVNQSVRNQQFIGIIVLVLVLTGIIVVVMVLFRKNKINSQLNEELNQALEDKDDLLKELHHRVKNNLQIVSSLLNLQASQQEGKKVEEILKDSRNRIESMATLHEKMYQTGKFNSVSLQKYVKELADILDASYAIRQRGIRVDINLDDISVSLDMMVPLGLILNEIFTNSAKHAFIDSESGSIYVMGKQVEDQYQLQVWDSGPGLPEDMDARSGNSLGFRLIFGLCRQLKAKIEIVDDEQAKSKYNITFKWK
ncbi:MAG: tetratricopeptide repeat protein [Bacteroidetes bacterium]|nr:MAG: tetratricopeptide repeat protein [Bacteroidota bacterium]